MNKFIEDLQHLRALVVAGGWLILRIMATPYRFACSYQAGLNVCLGDKRLALKHAADSAWQLVKGK